MVMVVNFYFCFTPVPKDGDTMKHDPTSLISYKLNNFSKNYTNFLQTSLIYSLILLSNNNKKIHIFSLEKAKSNLIAIANAMKRCGKERENFCAKACFVVDEEYPFAKTLSGNSALKVQSYL